MTINTTNYKLELKQDELTDSPREWDNLGTMICFHKRYSLGDKHSYSSSDYSGWAEMAKDIIKKEDAAVILPLYLYDHSGITMSTGKFHCPWDSGQVGFIVISKKKVRKEYSVKRISPKLLARVEEYLKNEVKTYDQFLTGDVYHFNLTNKNTGEEDSCGGFYGDDVKTNGVLDHIEEEARKEILEELSK
jgi:hypothetical protein